MDTIYHEIIDRLKKGPERMPDGFPFWVEWRGERFYTPQFAEIESMIYGQCRTLRGDHIEPDGHDHQGCPSWLLVLGVM